MTADEYYRLKRRDRKVLALEDFTERRQRRTAADRADAIFEGVP